MTVQAIALLVVTAAMALGVWIATKLIPARPQVAAPNPTLLGRVLPASIILAAVAIGVWLGSPSKFDFTTFAVGAELALIAIFFAFRRSKEN